MAKKTEPTLLENLEEIRQGIRKTAIAVNDLFANGNAKIIAPAAASARENIKAGFWKVWANTKQKYFKKPEQDIEELPVLDEVEDEAVDV